MQFRMKVYGLLENILLKVSKVSFGQCSYALQTLKLRVKISVMEDT